MAFMKKQAESTGNVLLVIDGSALVSTNFYGGVPIYIQNEKDIDKANALCRKELRQNKDGVYTHAVSSTISTIFGLMRQYNPTHIAVCFDKNSQTTFRKKMYPDYKATRAKKPDALKEQVVTTHLILKNIGIPTFWADRYEADDLAGSIITHFKNDCDKVLFVTKDHDWLQLIDHNVTGVIMMSSEERAAKMREEYAKYAPENDDSLNPFHPATYKKCVTFNENITFIEDGVYPKQVPDLKGLAGDSSDNIPGVKGIGPTTVIPLLARYHTVEGIYKAIDRCHNDQALLDQLAADMKANGIKRNPIQKLIDGRDDAEMSKLLATIITDLPINYGLERLLPIINTDMLRTAIDYYELDDLEYMYDWYSEK